MEWIEEERIRGTKHNRTRKGGKEKQDQNQKNTTREEEKKDKMLVNSIFPSPAVISFSLPVQNYPLLLASQRYKDNMSYFPAHRQPPAG